MHVKTERNKVRHTHTHIHITALKFSKRKRKRRERDKKSNIDRRKTSGKEKYTFETYKTELIKVLELTKLVNPNSTNENDFIEHLRYDLLIHLEEQHELKHKSEVKQLLKLLDTYIPETKFPYSSKETKNYVTYMRKQH